MKLRHHMILLILGPTLVIYVVILGLAGLSMYKQSRSEAERATSRLAASYSARLDGYLREAARVAATTARTMEVSPQLSDEAVYRQLEGNVQQMPLVYGACLAFEPGTRRPAGELFAPYVCRDGTTLRRVNIDRSVYDWYADPNYTWYTEPKRLGRDVWSPPYFDEGAGNILMSTYSAPFGAPDGKGFGGVVTVDIDLPHLHQTVGREINEDLDFVILASDGRYVYHPDRTRIMSKTVLDYANQSNRTSLAAIVPRMLSGRPGAAWIDGWDSDDALGVFYEPVPSTGWVFVCRMPAEVVLRGARQRTIIGASALVGALLLIGGCIWVVAGKIAAPISTLQRKVTEVSGGDLEAHIDESASTREIRALATSFNAMTADLRGNLERLAVERSLRERIEQDLSIAREIQRGTLPTSKPELVGYEIAGSSRSADQTGGDYYDWQVVSGADGERVLMSVADVSGHGVGPALVTAVCRAFVRASLATGHDLAGLLERLNDLLVADLPPGRFVTFAGVLLDAANNRAEMISAGHGPIFRFVWSRRELIESSAHSIPLGVMLEGLTRDLTRFDLEPGDAVIMVTDGLFDWANGSGERFGLDRLRQAIRSLATGTADQIVEGLYEHVRQFAGGAPHDDDITIVVLRRSAAST